MGAEEWIGALGPGAIRAWLVFIFSIQGVAMYVVMAQNSDQAMMVPTTGSWPGCHFATHWAVWASKEQL